MKQDLAAANAKEMEATTKLKLSTEAAHAKEEEAVGVFVPFRGEPQH